MDCLIKILWIVGSLYAFVGAYKAFYAAKYYMVRRAIKKDRIKYLKGLGYKSYPNLY